MRPKISISPYGTKRWVLNGKLHREDGPAIEYPDGETSWWLNNKLHREDGPAIERPDGTKEWWIRHKQYIFDEYVKKMNWSTEQIVQWKLTHE